MLDITSSENLERFSDDLGYILNSTIVYVRTAHTLNTFIQFRVMSGRVRALRHARGFGCERPDS